MKTHSSGTCETGAGSGKDKSVVTVPAQQLRDSGWLHAGCRTGTELQVLTMLYFMKLWSYAVVVLLCCGVLCRA
jgi:hypothetical protein